MGAEERNGRGDGAGRAREPLGDVARDVMNHASAIARDELSLARLAARRYAEHVRRDVAKPALLGGAAAASGGLAALFGLIALFLGIAQAIDSVAWAFAIYCALFAAGAALLLGYRRRVTLVRGEDILTRLPAVQAAAREPEHALVRQETPEAHRRLVDEARREAQRSEARPG
jgi:hypothetical protein